MPHTDNIRGSRAN